jgi:hypothetical protein
MGRNPLNLLLPNSTRAAGVVLNYESMLRSRWNLDLYWFEKPRAVQLSDDQYWEISKVYSIVYPLMRLIKQVQSDEFGAISYTFYFMFRSFVRYLCNRKWWCMETRKVEQSDASTIHRIAPA